VVVLHHFSKDSENAPVHRFGGHNQLTGRFQSCWVLEDGSREGGKGAKKFYWVKSRAQELAQDKVVFRVNQDKSLRLVKLVGMEPTKEEEEEDEVTVEDEIIEFLNANPNQRFSRKEIADELNLAGTTAWNKVERLVRQGEIGKDKMGRLIVYFSVNSDSTGNFFDED